MEDLSYEFYSAAETSERYTVHFVLGENVITVLPKNIIATVNEISFFIKAIFIILWPIFEDDIKYI